MLRDKLVDPGWYDVLINDVTEAPSKDGGSTNYKVEATVIRNGDGNEEFAGVPLQWYFNSKAISFAIGFLAALGVTVEPDKRYDLAQAKDSVSRFGLFEESLMVDRRIRFSTVTSLLLFS